MVDCPKCQQAWELNWREAFDHLKTHCDELHAENEQLKKQVVDLLAREVMKHPPAELGDYLELRNEVLRLRAELDKLKKTGRLLTTLDIVGMYNIGELKAGDVWSLEDREGKK